MAIAYKVLGQSAPLAAQETTLYTVPSATQAVCSTLSICNRGATDNTFRVRIKINNAADANSQFICFDAPVGAYDTLLLTFGATLNAGDVVRVYGSTANLTFQLFGSEIT
jgi:hypothetical protein